MSLLLLLGEPPVVSTIELGLGAAPVVSIDAAAFPIGVEYRRRQIASDPSQGNVHRRITSTIGSKNFGDQDVGLLVWEVVFRGLGSPDVASLRSAYRQVGRNGTVKWTPPPPHDSEVLVRFVEPIQFQPSSAGFADARVVFEEYN